MELSNLSSNWKKLQQTLQTEKKKEKKGQPAETPEQKTSDGAATNGVKRKRSFKEIPYKRQKMENGATKSKQDEKPTTVAEVTKQPKHLPRINCGLVEGGAVPGKYIAIDCEMVGIGPEPDKDSQLARVSITDFNGDLLYDSYVRPVVPVTDYRTFVSGIRPSHLAPHSARPFKEVQRAVAQLLEGRIVVGHAIKNDFAALIITHPPSAIRDTSKLPKYRELAGGRTPSLKRLASEILGLEIQGSEHSSIEDARATMLLFRQEKEEFEREHMKRFGRSNVPKLMSGLNGASGVVSEEVGARETTPQAVARKKRLAKKKAKKR